VRKTILILGGTTEAIELARQIASRGIYRTITSLAGRTRSPVRPAGELRIGGFGGTEALRRFVVENRVGAVIDATHPFAATISANATAACAAAGCPRLVLARPAWVPKPGDNWRIVDDVSQAAAEIPPGGCALLTTGHRDLDAFRSRTDVRFVVRLVEPPARAWPEAELILARGPFTEDGERELIETRDISVLVTKNSGGPGRVKLDAAKAAGIDVLMVARPPAPAGERVENVAGALAWLDRLAERETSDSQERIGQE